jgi:ribosomal protein S16
MLSIRAVRYGKRSQPAFRIEVSESASLRGGAIETLGYCIPAKHVFEIKLDRYATRIEQGAQPSSTVVSWVKKYQKGTHWRRPLDFEARRRYHPKYSVPVQNRDRTQPPPEAQQWRARRRDRPDVASAIDGQIPAVLLTMDDVKSDHDIRFQLSTGHQPDLLIDSFRLSPDSERYVSLGWKHTCSAGRVWQIAIATCLAHLQSRHRSEPIEWLVNYEDGEESGILGEEEVARETDAGAAVLERSRVSVNGIVVACDGLVFEADVSPLAETQQTMVMFWPEGHLSSSAVASALEKSGRLRHDEATALAPRILAIVNPTA